MSDSQGLSRVPQLLTADFADAMRMYAATRPWGVLIRVIPAAVILGVAVALSIPSGTVAAQSAESYRAVIRRGKKEGDSNRVEFAYAKLKSTGQLTTQDRFDVAMLYARTDPDRTLQLVHEIVNEEDVFVPAYLWWGRRQLSQAMSNPQARSEFEYLLGRVLEKEPGSVEGRTMMAQFLLQRGEIDKAILQLREVSAQDAWLQAQLGMLLKVRGRQQEGEQELAAAERILSAAFQSQRITVEGLSRLATVYVYQERFATAVELLAKAMEHESDPALRDALAEAYVAWANSDLTKTPVPWSDCMGRLQRAIELSPNNGKALERIAELAVYAKVPEAEEALNAILAKGEAPGAVHLVLGTRALIAGQTEQAQMHLEQAYSQSSKTPTLLNNLAWLLSQKVEPDLDRALVLINEAVRLEPQNASIHDTRGQILLGLKRWKEAVTELEIALQGMPRSAMLHASLAEAYQQLGADALAQEHARLAQQAAAEQAAAIERQQSGDAPGTE